LKYTNAIKEAMTGLTDSYFDQKEMKSLVHEYIVFHAKGKFPFGNLTLLHHNMFQGRCKEIVNIAAAVELLILAFDIFDDLEDNDNEQPPWMEHKEIALNMATGLLFCTVSILQTIPIKNKNVIIGKYCHYGLTAISGQHVDLTNEVNNEPDYFEMIRRKSGALTSLACVLGTAAAGVEKDIPLIEAYAVNIGIAAQIRNDLADIMNFDGKNDLINRKKTSATLYLLGHPNKEFDLIRAYYARQITKQELLAKNNVLYRLLQKSGVALYAKSLSVYYKNKIISVLDQLEVSKAYKAELIKFI
jgi:competence protein ComQ